MSQLGVLIKPKPKRTKPKGQEETLGGIGSLRCLVEMASQVFAYVQTHKIVPTKHVQFFVGQLYLSKVKAGFVFYYSKGFYLH